MAPNFTRAYAAAACLALAAAALLFIAGSNQNSEAVNANAADPSLANDGIGDYVATEPPPSAPAVADARQREEALAAIDSFLDAPVVALQDELMQPLRTELDRFASAGNHLIRSTIDSLPPSLRSAAASR